MRMSIAVPIAAAFAVAAIGLSSPVAATTLKEALKICNKRGNCTVHAHPSNKNVSIQRGGNYIFLQPPVLTPVSPGRRRIDRHEGRRTARSSSPSRIRQDCSVTA